MQDKTTWKKWNPGLDNDGLTLGEVKDTLPGNDPEQISALVRLLENPGSPIALKGAITLEHHDAVHILLGRGLLNQDEAFIVGYTMGTSKDISRLETFLFKTVATKLYPKQYQFNKKHLRVYDIALELGKNSKVEKIYQFPFEQYYGTKLGELRELLGIDKQALKSAYKKEQTMFPYTKASKRLPI